MLRTYLHFKDMISDYLVATHSKISNWYRNHYAKFEINGTILTFRN